MIRILAILLLLAATTANAGERDDIIRAFAKATPSVGALFAMQENGDMKFLCSATAVDRHEGQTVVLSANHCLEKGVSYRIDFGDGYMRPLTAWKIPHYEVDAQKHPKRYNEPDTDMALFLLPGQDVPILQLAERSSLLPGARVLTIGFPLGVTKITYEGTVAGFFNRLGSVRYGYMMLQIFGAPGSSGSAVLDLDGNVVSVLVSAKQAQAGLPVIFATPIEYKEHLIPVLNGEKK